jgi:hypothetical protein
MNPNSTFYAADLTHLQKEVMQEISAMDVKRYLADGTAPLSTQEFSEFWKSLSDEEKEDFKKQVAELKE